MEVKNEGFMRSITYTLELRPVRAAAMQQDFSRSV